MVNAIILCSGGIDSVVTANYIKKKKNYSKILILFFNYGQRTLKQERKASKKCAENICAEFKEIELKELNEISTSLINTDDKANELERKDLKNTEKESENWYVPCRNIIFLVYALAIAESKFIKDKEIYEIFTGFKNEGDEAYPDTTPEFVSVMNQLQKIATAGKFKIIAPLIKKDKEDIIKLGENLGVEFTDTYTCYVGAGEKHCGTCLSCKLRQEGFYWSGVEDVTEYEKS
ncbi:MAG: 7-cyano-7-deazaguanine synthase [Nanoarchaeota archaeon]|nr:7-cyano-7-deazaguanine synthase [Nanoarchaeota archaeon]